MSNTQDTNNTETTTETTQDATKKEYQYPPRGPGKRPAMVHINLRVPQNVYAFFYNGESGPCIRVRDVLVAYVASAENQIEHQDSEQNNEPDNEQEEPCSQGATQMELDFGEK